MPLTEGVVLLVVLSPSVPLSFGAVAVSAPVAAGAVVSIENAVPLAVAVLPARSVVVITGV